MRKRILIAFVLLILLTTITTQQNIIKSKFNITKINIENNYLIKKVDIENLLIQIYNKNLILLDTQEIKNALMQNSFIESFEIKKKYPDTIKIKIFEKKPIAILFNKKKKFYLSEKIDLIEYNNFENFQDLPYVFGNQEKFKIFYTDLKKINFPTNLIRKYIFFNSNRWDLETINKKLIRLPSKNYLESLENYMSLTNKKNFLKYNTFDYRIKNQLILK